MHNKKQKNAIILMIDFKEERVEVDRIELWLKVKDEYSDQNIGSPMSTIQKSLGTMTKI